MRNSFLVVAAVSLALGEADPTAQAQPAGVVARTAPTDAELKKLAKDLDDVSLPKLANSIRAVTQFQAWGTAARGATPYVLPLLQHPNPHVRSNGATVLGSINPEEALPRLMSLALGDPEARVRRAAAGAIADEPALIQVVRRAPRDAREVAATKLSHSEALRLLVVGNSDEPEIRGDALFALADKAVVEELARTEQDPAVRRWAEIAVSADPLKDLSVRDATCQRAPWAGYDITCNVWVVNSGSAAYESTMWQLLDAATGRSPGGLERIEPGETKKFPLLGRATTPQAGKVAVVLVSAVRRRPAVTP